MRTIGDLPLENVVTIGLDATFESAFSELMATTATELYVTDERRQLLGIVPDYELLKARLADDWRQANIADIMSAQVLCYSADTPLEAVLRDFRCGFRTRAAVLRAGQLIGQITRATLLRALCGTEKTPVPRPKFYRSELASNAITLLGHSHA